MAFRRKKTEFKPDPTSPSLSQRLYMTPQQQRKYLKWLLYAVLCVMLLVLQDGLFSRLSLYGATVDMVPCALLMICVLQGAEGGCVFLLVASLVYYLAGSAPGVYVILLIPLLGTVAAAFRQGYLRKGFRTTLLCTGIVVVLYEIILFLLGVLLGVTIFSRWRVILLTAGLSVLSLPLLFPFLRGIAKIGGDLWKE